MAARTNKSKRRTILIATIDFWIGNVMYAKNNQVQGVDAATRRYLLDHNYAREEVMADGSEHGG